MSPFFIDEISSSVPQMGNSTVLFTTYRTEAMEKTELGQDSSQRNTRPNNVNTNILFSQTKADATFLSPDFLDTFTPSANNFPFTSQKNVRSKPIQFTGTTVLSTNTANYNSIDSLFPYQRYHY